MRKMSKFRVWLIRKLGGEIPVLTKPIIVERTPPSVKLEGRVSIPYEMRDWYRYMGGEEKIKKKMWDNLFEKASPYMVCDCYKNEELQVVECRARLTVVKELQNG